MPDTGYCTVEDVRRALRERNLESVAQDEQIAVDAICGQTEWLQETTNRHWYEPDGLSEDTEEIIPTSPRTHTADAHDIPSSAHAGPVQMQAAAHDQQRWPVRHAGPYTKVTLDRRDVTTITELLVRDRTGDVTDWVASSSHAEGRGEDYYTHVDDSLGFTRLYLHTRSLPRLRNYDSAVTVTYDYGVEGITGTVRRAVALRAGAEMIYDEEADISIAGSGQLVNIETEAQSMEARADELLEVHQ